MITYPSEFEHFAGTLAEITHTLRSLGADMAILKMLPRNANDKNQVYFGSDFGGLHRTFALTLADRGASSSGTKDLSVRYRQLNDSRRNGGRGCSHLPLTKSASES